MSQEICVALSTFPEAEVARQIVRTLVDESCVACGNIIPAMESIYFWKNKIEHGAETLVIFKLAASGYGRFEARLKALHPYEVPEIIWISVEGGNAAYLKWVAESCSSRARKPAGTRADS